MSTRFYSSPVRGSCRLPCVVLLLTLLGPIAGCATSSANRGGAKEIRTRYNPALLTRAELAAPAAESSPTLYDALRQIRPLWLDQRGQHSFLYNARVQVALDGQIVGDIGNLREFRASDVEEARILDTGEAGSRYGLRAQAQRVIELTSRRGGS